MRSAQRRSPRGKVRRPTVAGFGRRSSGTGDSAARHEAASSDGPATADDHASTENVDTEDQSPAVESASGNQDESSGRRAAVTRLLSNRTLVVRVLVAVLVLGTGLGVWFGVAFYDLRTNESARNAALVDAAATQNLTGQVTQAIRTAFSYDFSDAAATEREAQNVLVGRAIEQYNQLFAQVKQTAPQQRLVFSSTVRSVGVTHLEGDHARLLVFVDQQGIRADTNERRSGSAQLDVSAQRFGDAWKISDIAVL